jgi:hypothetical protein
MLINSNILNDINENETIFWVIWLYNKEQEKILKRFVQRLEKATKNIAQTAMIGCNRRTQFSSSKTIFFPWSILSLNYLIHERLGPFKNKIPRNLIKWFTKALQSDFDKWAEKVVLNIAELFLDLKFNKKVKTNSDDSSSMV